MKQQLRQVLKVIINIPFWTYFVCSAGYILYFLICVIHSSITNPNYDNYYDIGFLYLAFIFLSISYLLLFYLKKIFEVLLMKNRGELLKKTIKNFIVHGIYLCCFLVAFIIIISVTCY